MKKIFLVILCVLLLTSCSNNKNIYVDVDKFDEDIKNTNVKITEKFKYDNKSSTFMNYGFSCDESFFYSFNNDVSNFKVNFENGRVENICNIEGCSHDVNNKCLNTIQVFNPVASRNGLYYIKGNSVKLLSGDGESTVYINDYYTEYETENYPDTKSELSRLVIRDDIMYVAGASFCIVYDLKASKVIDTIDLSNRLIYSLGVSDGLIYYSNDNNEFFVYDLNSKINRKLDDKVGVVNIVDDAVYFVKWDGKVPSLFTIRENDIVKIVDNCYVNFAVVDNTIYYQEFDGRKSFYRCDLNGNNRDKMHLKYERQVEEKTKTIVSDNILGNLYTAEHIDSAIIMDSENHLLYILKNNETEYVVIDYSVIY